MRVSSVSSGFCVDTSPNLLNDRNTWHLHEVLADLIGYGHMTGGFPGGQAEYVRIPFGEVNLLKVPKELSGECLDSTQSSLHDMLTFLR